VIVSDEDVRRPTHEALAADVADVVDAGGAYGAGNAAPQALLDMVRRLRARERGHLASLLHDGPIQELAAAALELGEVGRAMEESPSDEPDGLARQVHVAGRMLCRIQDELWPFPRPGSGLIETLKQRTAWLLATPLAVATGEGAAGLPEADIQTLADVTELILAGLGDAGAWDRPIVMVRARPDLIFLELSLTPALGRDPASGGSAAVKAWLHRLAAAIQARADAGLDDRRLRIWMEIPRCPDHRPGGPAAAVTAAGEPGPARRWGRPRLQQPARRHLELRGVRRRRGGKDGLQVDRRSVREDVGQIQQPADRAAQLTHQLLAFARGDVVQPRPLDLNEVITRVEQLLIRTLGEHVILKTDLAPQLCPVLADPGQIGQVLVNLAVNFRDAMLSGGTLVVQTSVTDVDESHAASLAGLPPGQYACMKISDTGAGMPRDVIEHAFEPFFTTRPGGEGTDLGVAAVYGIVTQAGGYVQVYSEPDIGTTVTISLPAAGQGIQAKPAREQELGGSGGETVLIVEDEPAMREVTRRILSRSGYNVIAAANGHEAVEIAASHTGDIDVLLTDFVMPGMLGKEAAERIRALRPGVKVLFMSGYAQGVLDSQGVVEAGVNLIQKPFSEAQLLATLGQIIVTATQH
jgi:signal transduction histidine kinase/ActR/RegA family two-component response regulator